MSLAFAAITPHPPILIPNIGKDQINAIEKTKKAMELMEQELYSSKPNLIIMISPHGSLFEDSFTVNAHPDFKSDFEHFGDLSTKKEWKGSPDLAARIQHGAKIKDVSVQLVSEEKADHGSSVALYYLANHLPDVKILPIGYSNLGTEEHLKFGELLKDIIMESDKRIAVIASGDLSHCAVPGVPDKKDLAKAEFDANFISLLETGNIDGFINLDQRTIKKADECGYRSTLILLGIIKKMQAKFKTYSYEAPFGVGYLVGNFQI